ncbi:MAG TPA: bacteriohemerythrin [Clostridium sp.]|jgi:hemerythrin|nr:hemerythrin family protein [Clostridia bacterium]HCW05722.1 bacteriohemerythrin [Clostridium sp.]
MLMWKDEYCIGIDKIDNQHKHLFEIGNRAYDLLNDQFRLDKYDRIVEIIEELRQYTIYHFKSEEEYMQSISYKKFFSQKVQHDYFIKKINEVDLSEIDENQDAYLKDLLAFVFEWILKHILEEDKMINS